VAVENYKILRK